MSLSAYVNGDNRGQGIVRTKEDGSTSTPSINRNDEGPDGEDDSKCYENAIVCDEARTDEINSRSLAKLEPLAEPFPAIHRLVAEELRRADLFSRQPRGEIKRKAAKKVEGCNNYQNLVLAFESVLSISLILPVLINSGVVEIFLIP